MSNDEHGSILPANTFPTETELTQDEQAVLMIANEGQSMIPIGRWEAPVLSLAERRMLQRLDSVNYVITDRGKARIVQQNRQAIDEIKAIADKIVDHRQQLEDLVAKAVDCLAEASQLSQRLSGEHPREAAKRWSSLVLNRVLAVIR